MTLTVNDTVAVIGAGTMGAGIAQVAAKFGHTVLLYDKMEGAAQAGLDRTAKGLEKLVARGKMSEDDKNALVDRIQPTESLADLAPARLVVEAIVENLAVKQSVFSELEKLCSEETILATNTSSISVTAIGAALKRPQNLVGMHFFNPAPIMKLVEVIKGLATSEEVAQDVYNLSVAWGKHAVMAKSTPGFIVNRVARPFYAEGLRVLQEGGADEATIDAIARESGQFRMGPFELMDLIGHDVNYAVTSSVFDAYYGDQRFLPSLIQKDLVEAGFHGRKTGRGFYDYSEGAEKPVASTLPQQNAPSSVTIEGDLGCAEALVARIEAAGISVHRAENHDIKGRICIGNLILALTDGRMATERAADEQRSDLVLFDLALNYSAASRIALTKADQTTEESLNQAAGLFQALGMSVSVIDDVPGMVLMRTVAMLANEGSDAVNQQVCDVAAVDIAMQSGVNYPKGPMAWADQIGLSHVHTVLSHLVSSYGEDRYRPSPLLRRKVFAQDSFHNGASHD
ncbi:3-hydroxyacyl-CoA dehydrogenase PaaH [Oceanospirillum sediminis]|uniref:3-hydroxyacyl-CoA dehydrogenase PaaC n=1 Tax=Oceanospirillum sediminis TaxID=2760088 RepID=A0A839ISE1_9GAMM|nr:3-hydroxyacyl-CoA dehydrogenase PaaH [Oceanospirillum sediminis]MBB1487399.1 3-hydroxyacyl-CoA dehydrogenase PaaC [Oceanospirillum sediminis]